MTKRKLQKILEKAGIQTNTLELRVFIPTENTVIYMQVGDGSQLDGDEDENGTPYDGYIDYKTSEWDYDENCFTEGDGAFSSMLQTRKMPLLVSCTLAYTMFFAICTRMSWKTQISPSRF